jgi:hypothetical protein
MLNFLKIAIVHFKCYVNIAYYFCCSLKAQHLYANLKCPQAPVHITLTHVYHVTVHNHRKFSGVCFPTNRAALLIQATFRI